MKCYDFGSYVAFSFKKNNLNQNAVFLKTENGLIYDGMLNMTGDFEYSTKPQWFPPFVWTEVHLDKWYWMSELNKTPYYYTATNGPGGYTYNDLVSVSSGDASFMIYDHMFQLNWGGCEAEAVRQGIKLSSNNITDNFIKFNEVELVGSKDSASIKINSFYIKPPFSRGEAARSVYQPSCSLRYLSKYGVHHSLYPALKGCTGSCMYTLYCSSETALKMSPLSV